MAMLPFLKLKDDGVGTGPVETKTRKSDGDAEYDAVGAIADDIMTAFEKKDRGLLKSAIEALCEYVREEDLKQDQMGDGDDD